MDRAAQHPDFSTSEMVALGEIPAPKGSASASTVRLWQAFMTARVMIAVVLLTLQVLQWGLNSQSGKWMASCALVYLAAAVAVRVYQKPQSGAALFGPQWVSTIGVDVLVFSGLQFLQSGSINYTPLFALPVLFASVLGSLLLAFATAAAVTLLLLADAWWAAHASGADLSARFLQAGLTGSGLFVLAFLANQLALRLDRQERLAKRSQLAVRAQTQVNRLVIESLSDGILVVNANGWVRAANPAAREMLGDQAPARAAPFVLASDPAWRPLAHIAALAFAQEAVPPQDIAIVHPAAGPRRVRVRTQITRTDTGEQNEEDYLCVIFMEDLREIEAKMRSDKLVAMGRMSAAVAHEIRNPLAAIMQANALMVEDAQSAAQAQLSGMIAQNAQRLARIVDDVLNVSRVQQDVQAEQAALSTLELNQSVHSICQDWAKQNQALAQLQLVLAGGAASVAFSPEHLRQIMVNLLDNALRYASTALGSINVHTQHLVVGQMQLTVWSDGPPLDPSVQRHLFEPFFSSESRSSGLGLYICRELCERYGALIGYRRAPRPLSDSAQQGNAFFVVLREIHLTPDGSQ